MAGMFYSIQEVAEKLNITEEKVKTLVKKGQLRGIPEGGSFLFKVDEIESLLTDQSLLSSLQKEVSSEAEGERDEKSESDDTGGASEISLELEADDTVAVDSPEPAKEDKADETKGKESEEAEQSEIFLAATGSASDLTTEDLTSGDTALTQEGVNVLGETDSEYQVTEDTKADTKNIGTGEPSLEEIEEDVNLDSFGSGSGLLDLSLQADDTSLGGILDDIYMSEGEEGKEAMPVEGSAMEMTEEAEQLISDEAPAAVPAAPGIRPAYAEPAPDTTTTTLVVLTLLISMVVAVYTGIIVLSASVGSVFRSFTLYFLGGFLALAIILGTASFFTGGESKTKTKKPKAKKEKKAKPKKEKKEKPKKEKKKKKGK